MSCRITRTSQPMYALKGLTAGVAENVEISCRVENKIESLYMCHSNWTSINLLIAAGS
jgi:hypothetical protein